MAYSVSLTLLGAAAIEAIDRTYSMRIFVVTIEQAGCSVPLRVAPCKALSVCTLWKTNSNSITPHSVLFPTLTEGLRSAICNFLATFY